MKFAIIGVGGYIAPRHLKAIKDTGNELVAALDKNDSVGVLDSYFPGCQFFTEFERFDRFIDRNKLDYLVVCSPNYLHDAHARYGLKNGMDVICEKPLCLNSWNAEQLMQDEQQTGHKVFNILQLRLLPELAALKETIESAGKRPPYNVKLTYITSRGPWYAQSWKGDVAKSGGLATNIGIHLFDLLLWLFGPNVWDNCLITNTPTTISGRTTLDRAEVQWTLSIDARELPGDTTKRTYRSIRIDGQEIEFSEGFTEMHTRCYEHIFQKGGFRIPDVVPAIKWTQDIRSKK